MNALLQNLGSSLTGNIPKAVLIVVDKSIKYEQGKNMLNDLATTLKAAANVVSSLDGLVDSLTGNSAGPSFEQRKAAAEDNGFLAMEVQYNPSTIQFDTVAGKVVNRMGGSMGPDANTPYQFSNCPAATTMHVQLMFDDVNVQNAFSVPDNPFTVGGAISSVSSLAKKFTGKEYTVQPQVDAIMSLLTAAQTRQVIFAWAKSTFHGELCNVDSRYTMFNTQGNPIRGVVNLSIRQEAFRALNGEEKKKNMISMGLIADTVYLEKKFTKVFKSGKINGASSLLDKLTNNNFLNNI